MNEEWRLWGHGSRRETTVIKAREKEVICELGQLAHQSLLFTVVLAVPSGECHLPAGLSTQHNRLSQTDGVKPEIIVTELYLAWNFVSKNFNISLSYFNVLSPQINLNFPEGKTSVFFITVFDIHWQWLEWKYKSWIYFCSKINIVKHGFFISGIIGHLRKSLFSQPYFE